jgi:hypothetical protein
MSVLPLSQFECLGTETQLSIKIISTEGNDVVDCIALFSPQHIGISAFDADSPFITCCALI